ncbi:hypothetical protein [Pseudomonas asplenii]|uniref:hypothetical protein n=1 Tax=Pseudomonas asplenii TaxID=53407 RepID=UPI0012F7DE0B|nr:hypothetical protein [Pseudomonas fuscovaginae]
MNTRLTTVAADLVDWAESLPASRRKPVACAIAQWACHQARVADLLGEATLQRLLAASYSATPQERAMLDRRAQELDEEYFASADKDDVTAPALLRFEQARALRSLLHACDAQDLPNLCDALYEAQAVTDDLQAFRQLCSACTAA